MKPSPLPRVLLVEDDPVSRAFMTAALEGVPVEVDSADSLAAAWSLANAQDYALWLFDAHLPDGKGIDLLARLRSRHPRTPALAHTASDDLALLDALIAGGFAQVLVKPLATAALQAATRDALGVIGGTARAIDTEPRTHLLWDDEAAALALNGNRAHIATLRGLFLHELPRLREQIARDATSGDLESVRTSLHKLRASCGFVGAARLGAAARALHDQADSQAMLGGFEAAAQETLAAFPPAQDTSSSG